MIFLLFLIGGVTGLWSHYYLVHFANDVSRQIYQNYVQIFPENPPHFHEQQSVLSPIKCGSFWQYFLCWGSIWSLLYLFYPSFLWSCYLGSFLILSWTISVIDWHYQLISPILCQVLLVIGILAAWLNIALVSLDEALTSSLIAWGVFYQFFYFVHWIYRQESFGRGDYWLISALASFVTWQELPLFILLACLLGLAYAAYQKGKKRIVSFIPFAPFLCLSMVVILFKNWVDLTVY